MHGAVDAQFPETRKKDARGLLLLAALFTVVVWQLPFGREILYPFTLLATYAHEMGHGLVALLLGCEFHSLELNPDGSGLAHWRGNVGSVGRALISAGGLIGPSLAGSSILVISRKPSRSSWMLFGVAVGMGLSSILFVRPMIGFGFVFVFAVAAVCLLVSRFITSLAPFLIQLIGVQLCLSVFRDVSYMFSAGAIVDGTQRLSDSAAIAEALFLPYWFWGGLVALVSFAVLAFGLFIALKPSPSSAPKNA